MKIDTDDTEEIRHATVETIADHTDIVQVLLVVIAQNLPGGTGIALPETITTSLLGVKETADEEITRGRLPHLPKNATTSVESAGVHLLLPAETIHEAYPLDLDASTIDL